MITFKALAIFYDRDVHALTREPNWWEVGAFVRAGNKRRVAAYRNRQVDAAMAVLSENLRRLRPDVDGVIVTQSDPERMDEHMVAGEVVYLTAEVP